MECIVFPLSYAVIGYLVGEWVRENDKYGDPAWAAMFWPVIFPYLFLTKIYEDRNEKDE